MVTNQTMTSIRGARADIERYNPRVTGSGGASSAWVMVARTTGGYAQIGYAEVNSWGDNPYYFWEYCTAGGYDPGPYIIAAVPNGGGYTGAEDLFTVQYVSNDTEIKYRIDGVSKHTTYQPGWTPNYADYAGEIWEASPMPQMPGDTNHKVDFASPAFYSNDAWHLLSPWGSNNQMLSDATYGRYAVCPQNADPQYFKIYDNRYSTLP
jgi:hypothetical protein